MTDLGHVLWIGGGTGGGKSSVAIALAEKYALERYSYDWHDARDHSERTRADRHPNRAAFLAMSLDERWVTERRTGWRTRRSRASASGSRWSSRISLR
jgi:adenylylsulfate kinase-like enzyme